jgi:hypothetical protein
MATLTAWEMLAIEVALEKAEKLGGFEKQSLKGLLEKIADAKTMKIIKK